MRGRLQPGWLLAATLGAVIAGIAVAILLYDAMARV